MIAACSTWSDAESWCSPRNLEGHNNGGIGDGGAGSRVAPPQSLFGSSQAAANAPLGTMGYRAGCREPSDPLGHSALLVEMDLNARWVCIFTRSAWSVPSVVTPKTVASASAAFTGPDQVPGAAELRRLARRK